MSSYTDLKSLMVEASEILLPPERISVNEAAAKYRRVHQPPAYSGPWDRKIAPYLDEIMEALESKDYSAVCAIAPAQSLKTEVILNWMTYNIMCDPSDMMIVEKSRTEAKNFSNMKVARTIRHSPEIRKKLVKHRDKDNTFDKQFTSGSYVLIQWPTEDTFSGKTLRRVALTDYDRMDEDIGGEGSAFDLARRRTNIFKRLGMTYVESSPSYPLETPNWKPGSSHEGPPCKGIVGIYNRGDRRRRYWQCPHCSEWFEPSFSTIQWPDSDDIMECAEQAYMACPHCFMERGAIITQSMRPELDLKGVWLRDGQKIDASGKIHGVGRRSDIASFWVKGPNTALGQWKTLVLNELLAMQEYESTGDEQPLKTTRNTDQGEVFIPPRISEVRTPEELMDRAIDIGGKRVPREVRFLIATIDVQKNRFEVQIHGVIPAPKPVNYDVVVIDRFKIIKSKRLDDDGERRWVKPGSYAEDWDLITEQVLKKTYPISGDESESRQMAIRLVTCDAAGSGSTTSKAYAYYRKLRTEGYAGRFLLTRGDPNLNAPRVKLTMPDSERKDRHAGARGEIPVLAINVNRLKDTLDAWLDRLEPGGGHIIFSDVFGLDFYKELCVEVKDKSGRWENPKNHRNETTDLLNYLIAACLKLQVEKIDWDNAPVWAQDIETNSLVFREGENQIINKKSDKVDISTLASRLG